MFKIRGYFMYIYAMVFKLGLDFHGVIDDLTEEFKALSKILVESGNEVHIITGGPWEEVGPLVDKMGIRYTHKFSIRDHHREIGTETNGVHPKYNFPLIDNDIWDKTKGDYCKKHNISLMIDDTVEYGNDFTTPFARLWTKNKKGGERR